MWHDGANASRLPSLLPNAPFTLYHTVLLATGIALVLAVASIVGIGLKITVAKRRPHDAIDNLNTRVNAWWGICIAVGLALLAGKIGVSILFAFASFVALREFVAPKAQRPADRAMLGACLFIILPLQYWFVTRGSDAFAALFIPVLVVVALSVMTAQGGAARDERKRAFALQCACGLVVCVWCISQAPALLSLDIAGYDGRNPFLLVFLILVVQSCDVLQYLWGKLAGRRRIAPTISPGKTVEGSIGGIASATLAGCGVVADYAVHRRRGRPHFAGADAARIPGRARAVGA